MQTIIELKKALYAVRRSNEHNIYDLLYLIELIIDYLEMKEKDAVQL